MSDYPRIKVLNRHLMMVHRGGTPTIEANIFEITKAYCIAKAKKPSWELPYLTGFLNFSFEENYPQLFAWYYAFTNDNSPGKVIFDGRLGDLIADIDFSKPFDQAKADAIRKQFIAQARKPADIDPADIAHGTFEDPED